jgi:hypothetical protein
MWRSPMPAERRFQVELIYAEVNILVSGLGACMVGREETQCYARTLVQELHKQVSQCTLALMNQPLSWI